MDVDSNFDPMDMSLPYPGIHTLPPSQDTLQHSKVSNDISSESDDEDSHGSEEDEGFLLSFPVMEGQTQAQEVQTNLYILGSESPSSEDSFDESDDDETDSQTVEASDFPVTNIFRYPESRQKLQEELLGSYICPPVPPLDLRLHHEELTESEHASITHFLSWKRTRGTVAAYKEHAKNLETFSHIPMLSLHMVRKRIAELTGLSDPSVVQRIDMCRNSCIAYTGKYANLTKCPYLRDGKVCNEPRYFGTSKKPRAQYLYISPIATIRAMYANETRAEMLRERDQILQRALAHIAQFGEMSGSRIYSDFPDSDVHVHQCQKMHLFPDDHGRDVALSLSSDGAMLTLKKQSNVWIFIMIILNLPPDVRYKLREIDTPIAVPGPNPPGDVESFAWPLFTTMAEAGQGIWMYDALESASFVMRAYIVMVQGDMPGSAKMSGMAGHSGVHGDRFSNVEGAKASRIKGSKPQYYPLNPPESELYNPTRPKYKLDELPLRTEAEYWQTIIRLQDPANASKRAHARIVRETGVDRMPLAAASPAFTHPSFFPLDPFHLFFENVIALLWDLWSTFTQPGEPGHIPDELRKQFGEMVEKANLTLPASFCGLVRNPYLKRNSQYKIFEWMAVGYWFVVPMGIELGFNPAILFNFAQLMEIIEFAMTIKERTRDQTFILQTKVNKFLASFEKLYVGANPEHVSRFKYCVFQLVHVPSHIRWNGSVRLGSQASCELTIGATQNSVRSKKAPFANIANNIHDDHSVRLLTLLYPELIEATKPGKTGLFIKIRISWETEYAPGEPFFSHMEAICQFLCKPLNSLANGVHVSRFGGLILPSHTLSSKLSDSRTASQSIASKRLHRCFEATPDSDGASQAATSSMETLPIFGEALAFFQLPDSVYREPLLVYHPFQLMGRPYETIKGVWQPELAVLPISHINAVVAKWEPNDLNNKVYILRKHPALDWLTPEERGIERNSNSGTEEAGAMREDVDF